MKHVLFIGAILTFLLNACSPQTIPTVNPVQAQASVIAAANTMVEMTMNPISTITPTAELSTPWPTAITRFIGGWHTSTDASEFDNSTTVVLALDAETPVQGWLETTTPTLLLRCREGKVEVYINNSLQANVEVGQLRAATVRLRFDSGQAFESVADESTDGKALFLRNPQDMIAAMLSSREMVYGFTPFNADPAVTKFDLRGLTNVIGPLQSSCRWNPSAPPTVESRPTALSIGSALTITAITGDDEAWKLEVERITVVDSVSASGDTYKAVGKYVLMLLQVTNVGRSPYEFVGVGNLSVVDSNGKVYEPDTKVELPAAMEYNVPFGHIIQPDEKQERLVVFDLPLDGASYSLTAGLLADAKDQRLTLDIHN